jgi:hypothetical protein
VAVLHLVYDYETKLSEITKTTTPAIIAKIPVTSHMIEEVKSSLEHELSMLLFDCRFPAIAIPSHGPL